MLLFVKKFLNGPDNLENWLLFYAGLHACQVGGSEFYISELLSFPTPLFQLGNGEFLHAPNTSFDTVLQDLTNAKLLSH